MCSMIDYFNFDSALYSDSIEENISILGNYILNSVDLYVGESCFHIREIEFYYYSRDHPDKYVHCNSDQLGNQKWYFHKYNNGTLKSGTYKGLDICVGNTTNIHCGILIRSIENHNGEFVTGSCNCVTKMLNEFGYVNSEDLVNDCEDMDIFNQNNPIYLSQKPIDESLIIFQSPRVGLSLKYPEYLFKNYRFLNCPVQIPKYRNVFIASLYMEGYDMETIIEMTNLKKQSVCKAISEFDAGINMPIEECSELEINKINIIYGNWYNNC